MDAPEVKRASLSQAHRASAHSRRRVVRGSSPGRPHAGLCIALQAHQPGRHGDVAVSEHSLHRSQVDLAELHFLLLHFLAKGPCRQAAASLQQEALQHQLLPSRTDFRGEAPQRCPYHGNVTLDMLLNSMPPGANKEPGV